MLVTFLNIYYIDVSWKIYLCKCERWRKMFENHCIIGRKFMSFAFRINQHFTDINISFWFFFYKTIFPSYFPWWKKIEPFILYISPGNTNQFVTRALLIMNILHDYQECRVAEQRTSFLPYIWVECVACLQQGDLSKPDLMSSNMVTETPILHNNRNSSAQLHQQTAWMHGDGSQSTPV